MEPMADGIEVGGFPIPSRHQGDGQPARHHARRGGVASARGVHSRRAVCGLAHGDEGGGYLRVVRLCAIIRGGEWRPDEMNSIPIFG